jgi:hypothetical protein
LFSLIGIAFSVDCVAGWTVSITFWAVMGSLIYLYRDTNKRTAQRSR